jgi:D-xylonolactonase
MADAEPRVLVDTPCTLGENPLWHPEERRIYWTDIDEAKLHRAAADGGAHEVFEMGAKVGGFTLQEDGALLLFMARGAVKLWRNGEFSTVIEEIPDERNNRFNDVIADPEGRVFCGVMTCEEHPGRLYRLDPDGALTQLLDGIGTSNGMGFTEDLRTMYYTDSHVGEIYAFDYDRATGAIANQRLFIKAPEEEGHTDGMTVDVEGCIWSARWGGSRLVRHAGDGAKLERYDFPAVRVSSVVFGGEDLADIFITTAGGQDRAQFGALAGALFHLRTGVKGRPEFRSRVGV